MTSEASNRSRRRRRLFPAALLAVLVACGGGGGGRGADGASPRAAAADTSASVAAPCPDDSAALAEAVCQADVAIVATVRAEELRHAQAPRSSVAFPGAGARDTLSCDTRRNLDRPVRAGRTYRDVEVRYRLMVRLDSLQVVADSAAAARDTARRP